MENLYFQEYEYSIASVGDDIFGFAKTKNMEAYLNDMAMNGWRLINAFSAIVGEHILASNTTMNQTILIFERKIISNKNAQKDAPNGNMLQDNKNKPYESRQNYCVIGCNSIEQFVPKHITLSIAENRVTVSLTVQPKIGIQLKGLQGDLIVYNIFGDSILLNDVCFYNFEGSSLFSTSSPFPIELPEKIGMGIRDVELRIKRYLDKDGLHTPDNLDIVSIEQSLKEIMGSNNMQRIVLEAQKMENAGQIIMYIRQLSNERPGLFTEEFIQEIFKLYTLERSSGNNLKEDAVWRLNNYLSKEK